MNILEFDELEAYLNEYEIPYERVDKTEVGYVIVFSESLLRKGEEYAGNE